MYQHVSHRYPMKSPFLLVTSPILGLSNGGPNFWRGPRGPRRRDCAAKRWGHHWVHQEILPLGCWDWTKKNGIVGKTSGICPIRNRNWAVKNHLVVELRSRKPHFCWKVLCKWICSSGDLLLPGWIFQSYIQYQLCEITWNHSGCERRAKSNTICFVIPCRYFTIYITLSLKMFEVQGGCNWQKDVGSKMLTLDPIENRQNWCVRKDMEPRNWLKRFNVGYAGGSGIPQCFVLNVPKQNLYLLERLWDLVMPCGIWVQPMETLSGECVRIYWLGRRQQLRAPGRRSRDFRVVDVVILPVKNEGWVRHAYKKSPNEIKRVIFIL